MRLSRIGCDIATTCSQLWTPEMKTGTVEFVLINWHSVGSLNKLQWQGLQISLISKMKETALVFELYVNQK